MKSTQMVPQCYDYRMFINNRLTRVSLLFGLFGFFQLFNSHPFAIANPHELEIDVQTESEDNPLSVSEMAEDKQVILFVDLFASTKDQEHRRRSRDQTNQWAESLKKQFPGRSVRHITVESNENLTSELKSSLDKALERDEMISHLRVDSHGGHMEIPLENRFLKSLIDKPEKIMLGSQDSYLPVCITASTKYAFLNNFLHDRWNRELSSVFEVIKGRFTRDATVLLTACQTLEGDPKAVKQKAQTFARVLGLPEGSLYAADSIHYHPLLPDREESRLKPDYRKSIAVGLVATAFFSVLGPGSFFVAAATGGISTAADWAGRRLYKNKVLAQTSKAYALDQSNSTGYYCNVSKDGVSSCLQTSFAQAESLFLARSKVRDQTISLSEATCSERNAFLETSKVFSEVTNQFQAIEQVLMNTP